MVRVNEIPIEIYDLLEIKLTCEIMMFNHVIFAIIIDSRMVVLFGVVVVFVAVVTVAAGAEVVVVILPSKASTLA